MSSQVQKTFIVSKKLRGEDLGDADHPKVSELNELDAKADAWVKENAQPDSRVRRRLSTAVVSMEGKSYLVITLLIECSPKEE